MNERTIFQRLRDAAWADPLVRRRDLGALHERHSYLFANGVAVALSLNR